MIQRVRKGEGWREGGRERKTVAEQNEQRHPLLRTYGCTTRQREQASAAKIQCGEGRTEGTGCRRLKHRKPLSFFIIPGTVHAPASQQSAGDVQYTFFAALLCTEVLYQQQAARLSIRSGWYVTYNIGHRGRSVLGSKLFADRAWVTISPNHWLYSYCTRPAEHTDPQTVYAAEYCKTLRVLIS